MDKCRKDRIYQLQTIIRQIEKYHMGGSASAHKEKQELEGLLKEGKEQRNL